MKLDLDDLERKAKAATPGPWSACSANGGNCPCRTVWSRPLDESPFCLAPSGPGESVSAQDWNFVAALNPATALALIARIRELEATVRGEIGPSDSTRNRALRSILERGAVP